MRVNAVINIQLTTEAIDQLIIGLNNLKRESTFVPPKSKDQPVYNAAMYKPKIMIQNSDYKITFSKLPPIPARAEAYPEENADVDLFEDE